MAEQLADEALAAIRGRLDAAPAGPWPITRDGYGLPMGFGPVCWVQVFKDPDLEPTVVFSAHARTDVQDLLDEIERLKAMPTIAFRAEHDGFILGHYATREQARAHCEDKVRQQWPAATTLTFTWDADDEDNPLSAEELAFIAGQNEECLSGCVVALVSIDREYDAEADS